MTIPGDDREFRERMTRIETLLNEVEQADPQSRARTREIVQGLMDLHAGAFGRILDMIAEPAAIERLASDDLVGSVLLLYGLHPLDLPTRVQQALEQARPLLRSHGGDVELLDLTDGVVRLRLIGSCHGCPSSSLTLKSTIEEALYAKAPDIVALEVEGVEDIVPADEESALRVALPMVSA